MDIGAYAKINDLSTILDSTGINIPRLRGLRLMAMEERITEEEIKEMTASAEVDAVEDLVRACPPWSVNSDCHSYCKRTDDNLKRFLVYTKKENGYERPTAVRWEKIHGTRRKKIKLLAKTQIRHIRKSIDTEIPDSCFDSNISLREIVIPDSVRTIGPYAFCSSGLENIHLGKHVKVIQHDALMDTKLKELRFPASVKELQDIGPLHASDVYLESSNIPSYFCSSVSETITFACDFDTLHKADSLAQPYVKVHTPKRTVYFPSHILIDTSNELSNFIEARNDFPENMFPYAIDTRIRFQIALAECRDLKSITAEKYLRKNIVDCVREFINIDEESALVDLFRMHLVDDVEALTEILQILPNSMVLAKAYLLNESEKLKLDDLSC